MQLSRSFIDNQVTLFDNIDIQKCQLFKEFDIKNGLFEDIDILYIHQFVHHYNILKRTYHYEM